ncbi:hypothetical protein DFH07DRAFT_1064797 [Mycena maculata]|uniref:Uncharacterized protein n=1 Tax=Mycena maculata TaxID=230809 RepID=A0AAD7I821_9AGAR|nr:hypothetical protein DFH07DRAFT_1064797 [Mycena maculata]
MLFLLLVFILFTHSCDLNNTEIAHLLSVPVDISCYHNAAYSTLYSTTPRYNSALVKHWRKSTLAPTLESISLRNTYAKARTLLYIFTHLPLAWRVLLDTEHRRFSEHPSDFDGFARRPLAPALRELGYGTIITIGFFDVVLHMHHQKRGNLESPLEDPWEASQGLQGRPRPGVQASSGL